MEKSKTKILYILGCTRSGTTIVNRILGQLDGFFSAGETYQIWQRSVLGDRYCGCGQRFHECDVWRSIFEEAFGGLGGVDAESLQRMRDSALRSKFMPRIMLLPGGRQWMLQRMGPYVDAMAKLYGSMQKVTGDEVIVDSSKRPLYGYLLSAMESVDLYVLHIVRDPRAVAFSWQRIKKQPDDGVRNETMRQFSPWYVASMWNTWNLAGERLLTGAHAQYLRIRYEDFVQSPQQKLQEIIELVGGSSDAMNAASPNADSLFSAKDTVDLMPNHTCSGNPNRFETGHVQLKMDDQWRADLRHRDKLTVRAVTWPMMWRYGYV